MNATHTQAARNHRNLTVSKTGYGHWRITCTYYGKRISTVTTDSVSVDNYHSDEYDRNREGYRILNGYKSLCSQIINAHKK